MNHLHKRIIDLSKKHGLSHLGSCLTSLLIIEEIFYTKKPDEKFVNSCAHNSLALYVVLEKYYGYDAEQLFLKHGVHCSRDTEFKIDCSGGSLGHGLPIACGMALADRTKNVYCLISDGECSEGSIYEAANVIRKYNIDNLKVYLNYNGWGAYDPIPESLKDIMKMLIPGIRIRETNFDDYDFLNGQDAHYCVLQKEESILIKL